MATGKLATRHALAMSRKAAAWPSVGAAARVIAPLQLMRMCCCRGTNDEGSRRREGN